MRETAKLKVLEKAKKAYADGLMAGTSGNMSLLIEGENTIAITPSSLDYSLMEKEDIVLIDFDGNILEGKRKPSSEWRMHVEIYKGVPEVKAIVHTHSPYATSFAVNHMEILTVLIEMAMFLNGSVEVSPYAMPGSAEVGINAVPILKKKKSCLMANHGVVAVGNDMEEAYLASVYTEDAAKIYHLACLTGTPVVLEGEG